MTAANRRRVTLLTPPLWLDESFSLDFPTLSVPMLVAVLRQAGCEVLHRDLNAEFYAHLAACMTARPISPGAGNGLPPNGFNAATLDEHLKRQAVEKWLAGWNAAFGSPAGLTISHLSFRDLVEEHCHEIGPFLRDPRNPFFRYFSRHSPLQRDLERFAPRIVGISITGPTQALAAFTIASLIKEWLPGAAIVAGGSWASLFAATLMSLPGTASLFDGIVAGEGETALTRFCQLVDQPDAWPGIPNLHFRTAQSVHLSTLSAREDLDRLPAPDFSAVRGLGYRLRQTVMYQTSRGCYWDRCVFCEHTHGCHGSTYRQKSLDLVLADLEALTARQGAERIVFADAAIAPERMRQLSAGILERGLRFRWWCFARPEKAFTPEHFRLARAAGCESVDFGLETANSRISELMCRGASLGAAAEVLRQCSQAGISVLAGAILRFPTETEDEALETVGFLTSHRSFIDKICLNLFNLQRGTAIHRSPHAYGLEILESPGEALRSSVRYRSSQPLTEQRAGELCRMVAGADGAGMFPRSEGAIRTKIEEMRFKAVPLAFHQVRLHLEPVSPADPVNIASWSDAANQPRSVRLGQDDIRLLRMMSQARPLSAIAGNVAQDFAIPNESAKLLVQSLLDRYVSCGLVAVQPAKEGCNTLSP